MALDPFIGELMLVPYNFAPRGYAFCQGQLLSIAQNTALFSLVGTNFGGNGTTTFGLPDLRGRVAMGAGQGPGLNNHVLGEQSGTETVTLLLSQIPTHTHILNASADAGDVSSPSGAFPANTGALDKEYKASLTNAVTMNGAALSTAGSSQAHSNLQPYLVLNYCIATEGVFPSRN